MEEERVEKKVVRGLWVAEARSYADRYPDDTHPLFLTLPGPAAHDVQLLIEEGLLELTETGAVSSTHQFRVVCVEQDGQAVTELNRRFPGMKIIEASFENLISWQTQFNWPSRSDRRLFCARIVNLDLNRSFVARRTHDIMVFPILEVVRKLLEIHTNPEPIRWTLCLTLHAETPWSSHVAESARTFMCENLDRDTQFRLLASSVLTNPFIERLFSGSSIDFMSLDRVEQQRFLMVFLPKKIAQLVQNRGWRLVTKQNLRYGTPPHAPMATWMLEFIPQESLISTPDTAYRQALHGIFQNSTRITAAGGRAEA